MAEEVITEPLIPEAWLPETPAASAPEPVVEVVPLKAGVYYTTPNFGPEAPKRLHQSLAHILISQSPLHCWHRLTGGESDRTASTERGTLAHQLLLGGTKQEIVVVNENDWKKKAAQEARSQAWAEGKLPVLAGKLAAAQKLEASARLELQHRGISLSGLSEITVVWRSEVANVWCEGRIDHLLLPKPRARKKLKLVKIYDVKFVADATMEACVRSVIRYGYDIQHAAYVEAVGKLYPKLVGRVKMDFIFIEYDAPHATRVLPLAGTMRARGQQNWHKACDQWKRYLAAGIKKPWPSFADDGERAECPGWAMPGRNADAEALSDFENDAFADEVPE